MVLGILGLMKDPLNEIIKRKIPRNMPCGEEAGRENLEDSAPLNFSIIDLPVKYDAMIRRSHPGTFIA